MREKVSVSLNCPFFLNPQFKSEDSQKSVRKDVIVERPLDVPEVSHVPPKSPVTGKVFFFPLSVNHF